MSRPSNKIPLSTTDPNFKYGRSKNIYWEKLHTLSPQMQGLAYPDHATETHQGEWRSHFLNASTHTGTRAPLHVEIGCNAGHVVLEWAKQNPDQLYIGIDWKFKQIYRLAEKAEKNKLKNLIAFRANADRLPFMFGPGEIDTLSMFFPDPWAKTSQKKNRTANSKWLRSLAPLLSEKGFFHLKTDHAEYFEYILGNLEDLKDVFEVLEMTKDLHAGHPDPKSLKIPEVTLFERLFIKDGLPIHSLKLRPRS